MTHFTSSLGRIVCQDHVRILILLIAWSGLGLASPTNAQESEEPAEGTVKKKVHPERRAHEMFKQISKTPGVDLDGNGKVSREERTAFLLALAVQGATDVLATFPDADHDNDGRLSVEEAYEFIRGNRVREDNKRRSMKVIEAAREEGVESEKEIGRRLREAGVDRLASAHQILDRTEWLLKTVPHEPAVDKMSEYLEFVSQGALAEFLRRFPDADSDGDGVLTQEERTAHHRELEFRELEGAKRELQAAIEIAEEGSERLKELQARLKRIEDREAEQRAEQESASGEEP